MSDFAPPIELPNVLLPEHLSGEPFAKTLVEVRRRLHRHPEIGFQEHETSRFLQAWFEDQGFEVLGPLAGTGFAVEIAGAHGGPVIGYRAELDALPAPDAKTVPYASAIPDVAHLCGHDAHMAMAAGVALLLRERREQMHGTVRVLFQPNEESIPSGAPRMVAEGAIEGLRELFCVHVDPTLDVGRVGLRAGAITAAAASWMVHVYSGEAGHSARPHETVDTVWVATQILNAYYQLPGRIHDARRTAVLTACRLIGGSALNVIPNEVEIGGTLRSTDVETLRFLSGRMQEVADRIGHMYGAEVRYEADLGVPAVINDAALIDVVRHTVRDLLGPEVLYEVPRPSMGGEDFAFYLDHLPGALVRVGSRGGAETGYPLHHSRFDVDERVLPLAAQIMAEVLGRRLARIKA